MFATISVPLFHYPPKMHKEKGNEVICVCRAQNPIEAAEKSIRYRHDAEEKITLDLTSRFTADGKTYPLIVCRKDPLDWVVYVKEIGDAEVVDLRHQYFGTWDFYCFKCTKLPA